MLPLLSEPEKALALASGASLFLSICAAEGRAWLSRPRNLAAPRPLPGRSGLARLRRLGQPVRGARLRRPLPRGRRRRA
jgi:hypothetical protein